MARTKSSIRRLRWGLAVGAAAVTAGGAVAVLPTALGAPNWKPAKPPVMTSVRGHAGTQVSVQPAGASISAWQPKSVAWPVAGAADAVLPSAAAGTAGSAPSRSPAHISPGGLPISVAPPAASAHAAAPAAGPVHLDVFDQPTAVRTGIQGVLLRVSRPATLSVDYSAFKDAIGADWSSRLKLVKLPDCVLTTPADPKCRTAVAVPSQNFVKTHQVTAAVTSASLLALTSSPSGNTGDYTATSLTASSTWNVGEQTGNLDWQYPLRLPPVPGDLAPKTQIAYSSQSVDGKTASTNTQPSWVGEGFDILSGFVERSYKTCGDAGGPQYNADKCWGGDNAIVNFDGHSGEIIRDDATGTWRIKNDDATRVEKLTGASNGALNGEYWRLTTTDGVQYYFGLNHLPGWTSGNPSTNSTWTVPVFGVNSGDPCHSSSGFQSSWCQQAWRWNLDYVVDPRGNAVTYSYTAETNYYLRGYDYNNNVNGTSTVYTRGGYLNEIDHGLQSGALFATPSAKVVFGVSERCITTSTFNCDTASNFTKTNASQWPDVPVDQNCSAGDACTGNVAPTFWSRKRLTSVTTQVSTGSGFKKVDTWTLSQSFPAPGDGTTPALWLDSITHAGDVNGTLSAPPVTFGKTQLQNRVDTLSDHLAAFDKFRVGSIDTESGGHLTVTYSSPDCSGTDEPTPQSNTRLCYPVYWAGDPPQTTPFLDWFRKYAVTQVVQSDLTGGAPAQVTTYDYGQAKPAWHFDTADGLVKDKYRTWGQWRGFDKVHVITGAAGQQQSETDYLYYQGMDGDRADPTDTTLTKSVTLTDSQGTIVTDAAPAQGFTREKIDLNGQAGTVVVDAISTPWLKQTAQRVRSWGTTTADIVKTAKTATMTPLAAGGVRTTETDTAYDGNGLTTQVNDLGDVTVATDARCSNTTYAQNTGAWMLAFVSRVETLAVSCAATPNRPQDVVSDTRTYYDGQGFGAAPTHGLATKAEVVSAYNGTAPVYVTQASKTYDAFGRETQSTDAVGRTTSTTYTPSSGPVTRTVETDNLGYAITTDFDPSWHLPLDVIDPNQKRTDYAYDALGRLTQVWQAGRAKSSYPTAPNISFAYQLGGSSAMTAVTTSKITAAGGYAVGVQLYDGFLRPRQTQTQSPGGGRAITDTFYDTRGLVTRANSAYYNGDSGPSTTLFVPTAAVPGQTVTTYDGAGRAVSAQFFQDGNPKWTTTTTYGGDRTSLTPPAGGTATTTVYDARGDTVEKLQYQGTTPSGPADVTSYAYTPSGKLTKMTDPAGNVWQLRYDLRGRKIESDDPDTGKTAYTYDDANQLIGSTDARGTSLAFTYDGDGRKTGEYLGSASGTKLAEWDYDTLAKGLASKTTRYVNGLAYSNTITGFDDRYQPTGSVYSIPSDPTAPPAQQSLAGNYTAYTSYNTSTDGSPHSMTYPAAGGLPGETVAVTYDEVGDPVTVGGLASYVTGATYSKIGQLLQLGMSDGSGHSVYRTYTYEDGTGRTVRDLDQRSTAPNTINDTSFGYDDAGNTLSVSATETSGQVDKQCFGYDYLRRLSQAWTSATDCATAPSSANLGGPAPYWQSYTYDVSGNRTGLTDHAVTSGSTDTVHTYGYPAAGTAQPHTMTSATNGTQTDTYAYDAAGNTTTRSVAAVGNQTIAWDAEGRVGGITANGATTSYLYNADGKQLITASPAEATLNIDGMDIHATSAGVRTLSRYYTFGGRTVAVRTNQGLDWMLTNNQDSGQVTVTADANQTVSRRYYLPYGAARGAAPTAWVGQRAFVDGTANATTGLVTLGARQYDPATGTFLSRDLVVHPGDPQQVNGYSYASDTPVNRSDPNGMDPPYPPGVNADCYYDAVNCGAGIPADQCARHGGCDNWNPVVPPDNGGSSSDSGGSWAWSGGPDYYVLATTYIVKIPVQWITLKQIKTAYIGIAPLQMPKKMLDSCTLLVDTPLMACSKPQGLDPGLGNQVVRIPGPDQWILADGRKYIPFAVTVSYIYARNGHTYHEVAGGPATGDTGEKDPGLSVSVGRGYFTTKPADSKAIGDELKGPFQSFSGSVGPLGGGVVKKFQGGWAVESTVELTQEPWSVKYQQGWGWEQGHEPLFPPGSTMYNLSNP